MYEEKDFILYQIQILAKGLGKFMGLEQIKEILNLNEVQQEAVTDDELESIIVAAKLELIITNKEISIPNLTDDLSIETDRLKAILSNEAIASNNELTVLNEYILQNSEFLR